MTNAELVALLRELRGRMMDHGDDYAVQRIDAALAAHEAEERVDSAKPVVESEVEWHTATSYGCDCDNEDEHEHFFLSGRAGAAVVFVYPEKAIDGSVPWRAALIHDKEGVAPTLDEAKSAAIAAARGMR